MVSGAWRRPVSQLSTRKSISRYAKWMGGPFWLKAAAHRATRTTGRSLRVIGNSTRLYSTYVGHALACPWSLYIFSSGRSGVKTSVGRIQAQMSDYVGIFRHFFAQQSDQVQCRGPSGATAPFGKRRVGFASFGAKGL